MIAEDQLINLEVLRGYTKRLGVDHCSRFYINGQEAIDAVKYEVDNALVEFSEKSSMKPVEIMLLDFQMPLKNGIQVVQEIRQHYKLK